MKNNLVKLLRKNWNHIVEMWISEVQEVIYDYSTRPIEELHRTAGLYLNGIIDSLETNSYDNLTDAMNELAPIRISQKFLLSDIQRAFLIGKKVILELLKTEYKNDSVGFLKARDAIEDPFDRTIFEYSDIYQELQILETEKRSLDLLKAEEERKFLQQIRAEREKLDRLVSAIGADIAIIDREMKVVWHNRYLGEGELAQEIKLGEKCNVLSWHQAGGCDDCATARAFQSGRVEQISIEKRNANGQIQHFQIIATPMRNPDGEIEQVLELVREVTNIRELERIVGTQQEFLEAIRNDSADAIVGLDAQKRITFWNKGAETIFGYLDEEILNNPFQLLVPDELVKSGQLKRIFTQVENDNFVRNYETYLLGHNNREVPVDLTLTAIHDENGKNIGISAVIRDISERKHLEEKVLQTERLATVGRMAAKVAHDIRNPLSSISLNAELLGDELVNFTSDTTIEASALLNSITSEVDRLAQISDEYLQFSRTPRIKLQLTDLNQTLSELIKLMSKELLAKKIRVSRRFSSQLPEIYIDKAQMHRSFLNLLRNAIEAMPDGGTLKLRTTANRDYIETKIIDTGEGIDEKELTKIFEPFHSTKEFGTGLGLTITRQIIEEHGGAIECKSKLGSGTEFIIQLPIREVKKGDLI